MILIALVSGFSPMHGDGWMPGESADETYEFFPYAWGWLANHIIEKFMHDVFPLCMGMVGGVLSSIELTERFSPMHGDGWVMLIKLSTILAFFPYAWGWLGRKEPSFNELEVFPYAWGWLADECEHSVIAEVFPCAWGWLGTTERINSC